MRKQTTRIIYALIALLLALALLTGCGVPGETSRRPVPTEEPSMPTAAPRPEETEAPGAPEEPPEDEAPGPVPQHSGVKPDGTLSRATLLMGDSLTAGLATSMLVHGTLGEARYIGIPSYSLQSFYSAPYYVDYDAAVAAGQLAVCSHVFKGMSLAQAAQTAGTSVEALYFMLGTNMSDAVTVENYTGTLRYLLNCCPDATLYAQTIPYSRHGRSDYDGVNAIIYESVEALREEGIERVFVLDVFTAIGRDHLQADGLHLDDDGLAAWRDAIVENAKNAAGT